ncbi:hypothetical protein EXIGLDRAFT_725485, partial [Exidia glandulosa HHB12029]
CGALGLSDPQSRASRSKRPRHGAQPGRILASVAGLSGRTRTASHPSARNTGSEPRVLSATYSVAVSRDLHLVADMQFALPLTHNSSMRESREENT